MAVRKRKVAQLQATKADEPYDRQRLWWYGGALLLLMGQAGRSRPVERTLAKVKARQQPFACTPWHLGVSVRAFALL